MPPRKAKSKKAPAPARPEAPASAPVPPTERPARRRAKKTVVILSRKRSLYSTRRLVEAIKRRGHRPLVLDTLRCSMILAKGQPRMMYRGVEIRIGEEELPRLDEGAYYHHQLLGLSVEDGDGRPLGEVAAILEVGGGVPVLTVRGASGESLIPFAAAFVHAVDLERKRIVVTPPLAEDGRAPGATSAPEKAVSGRAH